MQFFADQTNNHLNFAKVQRILLEEKKNKRNVCEANSDACICRI